MSTRCTVGISGDGVVHIYTECFDSEDLIFVEAETRDFSCSPGEVILSVPRSTWDEAIDDYVKRRDEFAARAAVERAQRIADLRREIASPRPAHLSEAFHATHIAAAQASLDRLLDTATDTDTDTRRGSGERVKGANDVQHCGHPRSDIQSNGRTHHCRACARANQ